MGMILIVEDDRDFSESYAMRLESAGFATAIAVTLEGAQRRFRTYQAELIGIIMDGALGGRELNTLGLIREFREAGFSGPMIAASASADYRRQMVAAGCTRALDKLTLNRSLPGIFQ